MIGPLLELVARRVESADVVEQAEETTNVAFEAGRLKSTGYSQETGTNLRVLAEGRVGFAGGTSGGPEDLLEAALASARVGQEASLLLPAPAALPPVRVHDAHVAAAGLQELIALGVDVAVRLRRDGCQVSVSVERAVGSVHVANTRGVDARHAVTSLALAAEVTRVQGDDVLMVGSYLAGAGWPTRPEIESLVASIDRRVGWAARAAEPPSGRLPVLFTPAGASVLLMPLRQALQGRAVLQGISPLGDRLGLEALDPALTLVDDPLLDGRPGSRPIDDEGVVSRRLPLIDRGRISAFVYDLETACRAEVPATGHGRRSTFGRPQCAYSNLHLLPGDRTEAELLAEVADGLLVDELIGVGQGNVIGGAFSHPVALAYRVVGGEVVGRVKDAAVAGNAYQLLEKIAGLGSEVEWRGSLGLPPILLEGVAVAPR